MAECRNCGAWVSEDYARVLGARGDGDVDACPQCPDKIRRNGKPVDARSSRDGGDRS